MIEYEHDELLVPIIKKVRREARKQNTLLLGFFYRDYFRELEIFPDASDVYSLKIFDRTFKIEGVKIAIKWEKDKWDKNAKVHCEINFSYKKNKKQLKFVEGDEENYIWDDYFDIVFNTSMEILKMLLDNQDIKIPDIQEYIELMMFGKISILK